MDKSRRKFIRTGAIAFAGLSSISAPLFAGSLFGREINIGLIGFGHRGAGLANLISKIADINIVAFCDIDKKRLEIAKSTWGTEEKKFYIDYKDLLQDKKVEAVIIATPLYLHFPMCVNSIAADKHVYVEKTMAYNIEQALEMVKIVESSNKVFQVGHQYRYYNMYHKLKEVIDNGWLGDISHIESQYNRNSDWRRPVGPSESEKFINWRLYKEFSGGLMAELCAHQIDIVNWFLGGHPNKVTGFGGINYWKDGRDVYDNVKVIYEYDNGVKSEVTSVSSNQHNSYETKILGSKGTLEIGRDKSYFYPEPTEKKIGTVDGVTGATIEATKSGNGILIKFDSSDNLNRDPTAYALMAFASCIKEGKKPFCDVVAGKNVAVAVHLANTAMDTEQTQYWKKEYNT